nr:uncharacterized protein LOC109150426 [Ipomoea batatas]
MNSFVKSGKDNTGAVHKDNFSSSNTFFVASRQVKAFFFNILVKGLAAFTYGINYVGPKDGVTLGDEVLPLPSTDEVLPDGGVFSKGGAAKLSLIALVILASKSFIWPTICAAIRSIVSFFDRLGSNPKAPKRKAIHDRLEVVQDVKNNASHLVKRNLLKGFEKGENEESVGSGDDVVPPQDEEASSFHITLCDETPIEGEDAEDAPHELEEGVRAAIDELKEVDLGTLENPRPIFISTLLSNEDEEIYVTLLKEYIDVFAWTYKEMPGLDPKVAVHRLAVKKACRPVKQAQWRFRPELIPSIEVEVNKLIEAGFIRERAGAADEDGDGIAFGLSGGASLEIEIFRDRVGEE